MLRIFGVFLWMILSIDCALTAPKRVLIIGDSISIGYMPYLVKFLGDDYEVHHNAGNAQDTANGVINLENWLNGDNWDIVSFNFGLWDMCYRLPGVPISVTNRDKMNGVVAVSISEYQTNLRRIVKLLKGTGAAIIWQNITYVPDGEACRPFGSDAAYNVAAAAVMEAEHIPVSDLNTASKHLPRIAADNVHYTDDGYRNLAAIVATSIRTR